MAKHITKKALAKLHKSIGKNTENGACLTGHNSRYSKSSCSYRWQAHEVSKAERTSVYNKAVPKSYQAGITTNAYTAKSGKLYPSWYAAMLNYPTDSKAWHLDGPASAYKPFPKKKEKIPAGKNFTRASWPYWHNAHHLIPKGLFNDLITGATSCENLIRQSLLEAKYNINHKINMMILPQDKEVAKILKLPRHLILKESGREELFDHAAYNILVEKKLKTIINGYKRTCDNALKKTKPHDVPKATLDKKKLEALSRKCYRSIIAFGKAKGKAGTPIADMPPLP